MTVYGLFVYRADKPMAMDDLLNLFRSKANASERAQSLNRQEQERESIYRFVVKALSVLD